MDFPKYRYSVEECDVPAVRRPILAEYRSFRCKCLEYLDGNNETSVINQIHDLAWHTAVFRTLNQARYLEPQRAINGAFWELTTAGYANIMSLGIRKLVDKHPKTISLWKVVTLIERRPELLTREIFVCFDGLPYDYEAVYRDHLATLSREEDISHQWLQKSGPKAWSTSKMLHEGFDGLSGVNALSRKRSDTIQPHVLNAVKAGLSHPAIEAVCTLVDRRMAHAEYFDDSSESIPTATYNDIDLALQEIVKIANFLSGRFFYGAAIGSVIPTPQFDILKALDEPWITSGNLPALYEYWDELSEKMDSWANGTNEEFLTQPQ